MPVHNPQKVVMRFKGAVRGFFYILAGVIVYFFIVLNFHAFVFQNPLTINVLFVHYFLIFFPFVIFLLLYLIFQVILLSFAAKKLGILQLSPFIYIVGMLAAAMSLIVLPIYVGLFWVVANRVLKKSAAKENAMPSPALGI